MERYSDDELLYLMRRGNDDAKDTLIRKYNRYVLNWLKASNYYPYIKDDIEDYAQVCMMSFWEAIDSYRDDHGASFYTFMKMVVLNRVSTVIKNDLNKRYMKDFRVISLDDYVSDEDGLVYEEIVEDSKIEYQPNKIFAVKETTAEYLTEFETTATFIEKEVMMHKYAGYDEKEISEMLNISIKSVYNAVYRSHKKSALTMKNKCDKL